MDVKYPIKSIRYITLILLGILYLSDLIDFLAQTNQAARCGLRGNAGEGLALVAEEVLAGSWCVVNFVLASEQGSQVFVDVVHISPRGFL